MQVNQTDLNNWYTMSLVLAILVLTPNLSFAQHGKVLSPYEQMANGILPEKIVCPDGTIMIVKLATNSPVCIKSGSVSRLINNHWGINPRDGNGPNGSIQQYLDNLSLPLMTNIPNSNFTINYSVTGAIVTGLIKVPSSSLLSISLQTQSDGSLTIEFPRKLLESKILGVNHYNPNLWYVYVLDNGQEVDHQDVKTTDTYRIIQIPFIQGTTEIQVVEGYPI